MRFFVCACLGVCLFANIVSAGISEWESATTPLAGLRVVMRARWSWIDQHDAWFSFSVDELLAYAARVMLLEQWCRTDEKEMATT